MAHKYGFRPQILVELPDGLIWGGAAEASNTPNRAQELDRSSFELIMLEISRIRNSYLAGVAGPKSNCLA
jgi:hypothetical protein